MKGLKENPSLDSMESSLHYAITINMSKVCGHLLKDVEDYFKLFHQLLKGVECEVRLRPELSKKGRLHYHGVIRFHNHPSIGQFYLNTYFKCEVQHACNILWRELEDDETQWDAYCRKQRFIMKPLFAANNLMYHYHKVI